MGQRTFTVGIPEELEERVVAAARSWGVSRNAFVRQALEASLISNERMARALPPEALEAALGQTEGPDRVPAAVRTHPPSSVPPRAPEMHPDLGLTKARLAEKPLTVDDLPEGMTEDPTVQEEQPDPPPSRYGPRRPRGKPFDPKGKS